MTKVQSFIKQLEKFPVQKKDEMKFFRLIEKGKDHIQFLESERMERWVVWAGSWAVGLILLLMAWLAGHEPTELSGGVSGTDQSGSLKVKLDFFFFGLFCFVFPLLYIKIRKWSGKKEKERER